MDDRRRRRAPETILLAPLPADPSANEVAFRFTGTDNGTATADLDFECSLDARRRSRPCSSPLEPQRPGRRPAHVPGARDRRSSRSPTPTPASHTWNVVAPPATQITLGARRAAARAPTRRFEFFDQPGSTYECRLDPVETPAPTPWAACTSPESVHRPHERRARVRGPGDHAGAERLPHGREPAGRVRVDDRRGRHDRPRDDDRPRAGRRRNSPPRARRASLFSGTDNLTAPAELTFECSLDGAAFVDCQSGDRVPRPRRRRAHLRGARVRPAGNVDETPGDPRVDDRVRRRTTRRAGTTSRSTCGGGATVTFAEVTAAGVTSIDMPRRARRRCPARYSRRGALFFDVSTTATLRRRRRGLPAVRHRRARRAAPPPLRRRRVGRRDHVARPGERHRLRRRQQPVAVRRRRGARRSRPRPQIVAGAGRPDARVGTGRRRRCSSSSRRTTRSPSSSARSTAASWSSCDTPYPFNAAVRRAHAPRPRGRPTAARSTSRPAVVHAGRCCARPVATIDVRPRRPGARGPGHREREPDGDLRRSAPTRPPSTFECRLTGEDTRHGLGDLHVAADVRRTSRSASTRSRCRRSSRRPREPRSRRSSSGRSPT